MTPSSAPTPRFVRRLGPHHFAYLRAASEGLDVSDCARRYLGITHGHEAKTEHHEAVDAVRAVARRHGESAWRLIGLAIRTPPGTPHPSLEAFAQQHGLEAFSESEVLTLYEEAFPLERKTGAASACGSSSWRCCAAWSTWLPRHPSPRTGLPGGSTRPWRPSSSPPAFSPWAH